MQNTVKISIEEYDSLRKVYKEFDKCADKLATNRADKMVKLAFYREFRRELSNYYPMVSINSSKETVLQSIRQYIEEIVEHRNELKNELKELKQKKKGFFNIFK